jgi:hypothetical protein
MNNLIRQFERDSHIDVYGLGLDRAKWESAMEKFAELIVRECMRMCDVADMSLLEHNCVKEASGTQSAKDFIKEHFGVEE